MVLGAVSCISIVYFYILQRNFSKNHREFTIALNSLQDNHRELSYLILQNSISVYGNQDQIAKDTNYLLVDYETLSQSHILNSSKYKKIQKDLLILKEHLKNNSQNVEEFLMLSAGIKNSLLFLTRHVENGIALKHNRENIFFSASKILKHFNDAIRMQDLDYLKNGNFLLPTDTTNQKIKDYATSFNAHSSFLIKKYPEFIQITKQVLSSNIDTSINKIRTSFFTISRNDFAALDMFALILFTVFSSSLLGTIFLLFLYIKENKKLLETKESLEHSLSYDLLTNLYNRRMLEKKLKSSIAPHLLLLDIDEFKHINDIYGNAIGNLLLQKMARFIQVKLSDIPDISLYRLSADEFGVLFDDTQEVVALSIAHMLEKEIAKHIFTIDDLELNVLVSISSNNVSPILENADLALKLLKKDYTKRVLAYQENLNLKKSAQENFETVALIRDALAEDRIIPYFQPIINLKTSKIEKYEALVRLQMKNGTILSPFRFLEVSKKTPYYREITKVIIEKTLATLKEYPSLRFSINISMIDILDEEIVKIFLSHLRENMPDSSRLDIELLESENIQNIEKVKHFIGEVKKFGSQILLDDFGSGYSNFAYFSDLDIDMIKIDGSIISEITTSERKLHMLKSIYQFSKGMHMINIAEFVETREMALLLKEVGVKYAQGYYFSQPLAKPLDYTDVSI